MKRKLTTTCFLSALWLSAFAQTPQIEYCPFAIDGKIWETQVGGIKENVYGNRVDGDTLIDGKVWKKVYNYVGFLDLNYTYYASIRDEDKKVYAIAKRSSRPRLLYDYGLKVGEMVECGIEGTDFGCLLDKGERSDTLLGFPFRSYLRVERIDTIRVHGLACRRFTLSLLDAFKEFYMNGEESFINHVVWVEGVGSLAGPFSPWMPLPASGTCLQSCEISQTGIFGFQELNESENVSCVGDKIQEVKIQGQDSFDLSGRRIRHSSSTTHHMLRGIYIAGGRKVVVK